MSCASKHIREFQGPQPGLIGLKERRGKPGVLQNPWQTTNEVETARLESIDDMRREELERRRAIWEAETREKQIQAETMRRFQRVKQSQSEEVARKKSSCDQLRGELSKRKAYEIATDQRIQIDMKQQEREINREKERQFEQLLAIEMEEKYGRDSGGAEAKADRVKNVTDYLLQQMGEREAEVYRAKAGKVQDKLDMDKLQRQVERECDREAENRRADRRILRAQLDDCIRERRTLMDEERAKVDALDALILKRARELELKEEEGKTEEKERARREELQYLKYTRESRKAETEHEQKLEAIIDRGIQDEAKRQAARKARERSARERLAHETVDYRQRQIQEKAEKMNETKQLKQAEAIELEQTIQQVREEDKARMEALHSRLQTYRTDLEEQLAQREYRRAQLRDELSREQRAGRLAEEQIRNRIDAVIINTAQPDTFMHPWRKMLDIGGHPEIPVWTGEVAASPYSRVFKEPQSIGAE